MKFGSISLFPSLFSIGSTFLIKVRIERHILGAKITMLVTLLKVIQAHIMTLYGNLFACFVSKSSFLLLVIRRRRSRFVDYIDHIDQTITRQKRLLTDTFQG